MPEPQTRSLTSQEIALVTGGLDNLRRRDAGQLAKELINAVTVAVVTRVDDPRPVWSESELAILRQQATQ